MSDLKQQFREDRAVRDIARRNFEADLTHTKAALSPKNLMNRITDRVGEGTHDAIETAKEQADTNPGVIAGVAGAIVLWFARKPLLRLIGIGRDERDLDRDDYRDQTHSDHRVARGDRKKH